MAKIKVDFTGVSDGGGFDVSPGRHSAKVKSIEYVDGKSTPSGYASLKWMLVITEGIDKGKTIRHNTTFKPEGLFNLRNTMIACGLTVPKAALNFDPDKLVGKELGIEVVMVADKVDKSKEYANVKSTFPLTEEEEGEGEDEIEL